MIFGNSSNSLFSLKESFFLTDFGDSLVVEAAVFFGVSFLATEDNCCWRCSSFSAK